MTIMKRAVSLSNTPTRRRWLWACRALCVGALVVLSGCVSTQQRGDRAYKSGRYNEALDHYERAIDNGDDSAQIYSNAAQAALRIGDFSLAERYFSRALRKGGGEEIAREMADFYIATSNYTKAVRVLQTVLETADDPQTVFNDLGAALMYAGSPLNAESYLMVAQQMKPKDPVPYVNLGVLYDKYLQNPRLAYGFYKCFLELSGKSRQRGKVRARVVALESRFENDFPPRYDVSCAQPYQPMPVAAGTMKAEIARQLKATSKRAQSGTPDKPDAPITSVDEGAVDKGDVSEGAVNEGVDKTPTEPESSGEATEIKIDRGVTTNMPSQSTGQPSTGQPSTGQPSTGQPSTGQPSTGQKDAMRTDQVVTLAEQAFSNHNHREVVELLKGLPADALTTHLMGIYGQSLASVGEYSRARRWLTATIAESPTPPSVQALWSVYRKLGDAPAARDLCERFESDSEYGGFLKKCATTADATPGSTRPGAGGPKK